VYVWQAGTVQEIMPAQMHMHLSRLVASGTPPAVWVGAPGAQGIPVAGTQGCGVNTPEAAAVAEITAGLLGELHMPNGIMFTMGAVCTIVAVGTIGCGAPGTGVATKVDGAAPKVHCSTAPVVNGNPMSLPSC
jgi:hypothetical protein